MKHKLLPILITISMIAAGCASQSETSSQAASESDEIVEGSDDADTPETIESSDDTVDHTLDYSKGIADGIYGWTLSEAGSYYMLSSINEDGTPEESTAGQNLMGGIGKGGMRGPQGLEKGDLNDLEGAEYQTMLVFVPADYMTVNDDGSASFTDAVVGGYTAKTAPIIFQNNNAGWRSGTPGAPEYADTLNAGMIYVSCGSRSRDAVTEEGTITGKAPVPVADLKAGVIALRANSDVIPGDKEQIISVGASGGGQMSSALGATGNMEEYYPYLYEAGAIGVTYDETTNTYNSKYDDSVYGAMAYCPIADIENADLAYAWMCYDSTLNKNGELSETAGSYEFTDFQLALQEDAAYAFAEYINSLNLTDENGNQLSFAENEDGTLNLREGTYYDAILKNISDVSPYQVIDLASFITDTGLVRNKDIPGFDAFDMNAENDAFGASDTNAVHFSASIAQLLKDNYETYEKLDGFDPEQIALYIQNALTGEEAGKIAEQTYLVNGTRIMLDVAAGTQDADIAKYWRIRSGTADPHTSFSVGYNIAIAAQMAGAKANYSLVWAMGHGSNEGTTTGTLVDWVKEICTSSHK